MICEIVQIPVVKKWSAEQYEFIRTKEGAVKQESIFEERQKDGLAHLTELLVRGFEIVGQPFLVVTTNCDYLVYVMYGSPLVGGDLEVSHDAEA